MFLRVHPFLSIGVQCPLCDQYLNDPWAPGHAVLCVWKPERRSFTHSRSHDRSLKVRFFRSQSESSRTIHVGGRTDTRRYWQQMTHVRLRRWLRYPWSPPKEQGKTPTSLQNQSQQPPPKETIWARHRSRKLKGRLTNPRATRTQRETRYQIAQRQGLLPNNMSRY